MREHVQPDVFGGAFRDHAALGDLMKTVTKSVGANQPAALSQLAELVGALGGSTRLPSTEDDDVATQAEAHAELELPRQAGRLSDGAEVYAALVALIVLSLLVAGWLHEAERTGPSFAEVNRFDLLQSADWAVEFTLLVAALVWKLLRGNDDRE